MTQNEHHKDTINEIDHFFSDNEQLDKLTKRAGPEDRELVFFPWYARFLTTLAVAVDDEEIRYFNARTDDAGDVIRVELFTPTRVITACIDMGTVGPLSTQPVQMVSRGSITSLTVEANASSEEDTREWPGDLEIEASYKGLTVPLRLKGPSHRSDRAATDSPLWELLSELRADLTRATN